MNLLPQSSAVQPWSASGARTSGSPPWPSRSLAAWGLTRSGKVAFYMKTSLWSIGLRWERVRRCSTQWACVAEALMHVLVVPARCSGHQGLQGDQKLAGLSQGMWTVRRVILILKWCACVNVPLLSRRQQTCHQIPAQRISPRITPQHQSIFWTQKRLKRPTVAPIPIASPQTPTAHKVELVIISISFH